VYADSAYRSAAIEAKLKARGLRSRIHQRASRNHALSKAQSLTRLREKLVKIGAKIVSHGRYIIFQMAEVAVPKELFQEILRLIAELRPQPPPAPA
jgi:IS5 family transposase